MGYAVVLAGPSAVGKTTVANALIESSERFEYIRSATSRPPRGDGNDSEYIYVSREEFLSMVDGSRILEYTEFDGNFYGTPLGEIERVLAAGKSPVMVLDTSGALAVKAKANDFDAVVIYLYNDLSVMKERLYKRLESSRSEKNERVYYSRLEANKRDYRTLPERAHVFDAFIKTDELSATVEQVLDVISNRASGKSNPQEALKIARVLAASADSDA